MRWVATRKRPANSPPPPDPQERQQELFATHSGKHLTFKDGLSDFFEPAAFDGNFIWFLRCLRLRLRKYEGKETFAIRNHLQSAYQCRFLCSACGSAAYFWSFLVALIGLIWVWKWGTPQTCHFYRKKFINIQRPIHSIFSIQNLLCELNMAIEN